MGPKRRATSCDACASRRPQVKAGSLKLLALLAKAAPKQLAAQLPTIVPAISECMYDAKQQVKVRV